MKTVTKQNLLLDEIAETKISGTVDSFISAYSFIKSDSFINVARGSSLLPQEVLSEAFKLYLENQLLQSQFLAMTILLINKH